MKTSNELGDAAIQVKYRAKMNEIARTLDTSFNGKLRPRKVGFVLLVFEYGEKEGRCNYISNGADRRDIVKLMKEQIKRFEADIPPEKPVIPPNEEPTN